MLDKSENKSVENTQPSNESEKITENIVQKTGNSNLKNITSSLWSLAFFIILLNLIPQIENWIGQDNIRNFITSAGIFAPIVFVIVRILTVIIAPLRLGPLSIILHRAFGFWPSLIYAVIVIIVGSFINFIISKRWGQKLIKFFFGPDILNIVDTYAEKYLNKNLLSTCLLFISNYELVSYASGLTNLKTSKMLTAATVAALITSPLLVLRDLSIGNNDTLATFIFILGYALSLGPILIVGWDDIKIWWKSEMDKINQQTKQSK